jgi:tetratricopeptide (TPR) repeat protein
VTQSAVPEISKRDRILVVILTIFLAVIILRPFIVELTIWRGDQYWMTGQFKAGLRSYKKALLLDPNNARIHDTLGYLYQRLGYPKKAIAEYEKAIKADPKNANYYFYLGMLWHNQGNEEKALELLEKASKLSKDRLIWHSLVVFYKRTGQVGKAMATLKKLRTFYPDSKWVDEELTKLGRGSLKVAR